MPDRGHIPSMRALRGQVSVLIVLLLVAACAGRSPRPTLLVITDPQAHQRQREASLATRATWSLVGRVAVSSGREGGSGRIDWQQDGDRYLVSLSAPVTRQSWRLSGAPGQVRLEGIAGGPREGADAAALLRTAMRWEIPVEALASWVRGIAAEQHRFGAVSVQFANDGRVSQLSQNGWVIAYDDWRPGAAGLELPYRLTALRDEARVRLVVDQWQ